MHRLSRLCYYSNVFSKTFVKKWTKCYSVDTCKEGSPQSVSSKSSTFDVGQLNYLVCPLSKHKLKYDAELNVLICEHLQLMYPIEKDGTPNLLPQSAKPVDRKSTTD